jgi:hypothetical protein
MSKNTETNKEVKTEVKEESIPKKAQDAYDALAVQVQQFNADEIKAGTMKTKALGAIEVLVQMYPGLQEKKSDS